MKYIEERARLANEVAINIIGQHDRNARHRQSHSQLSFGFVLFECILYSFLFFVFFLFSIDKEGLLRFYPVVTLLASQSLCRRTIAVDANDEILAITARRPNKTE